MEGGGAGIVRWIWWSGGWWSRDSEVNMLEWRVMEQGWWSRGGGVNGIACLGAMQKKKCLVYQFGGKN